MRYNGVIIVVFNFKLFFKVNNEGNLLFKFVRWCIFKDFKIKIGNIVIFYIYL